MEIKRILLATDFSDTANLALKQAIILAAKYDAMVVVLHARLIHEDDPSQLPEKLAHLELTEDQIEGELFKYIKGCTDQANHIKIQHEVIRGYSAHSAILSYLNENEFDLVLLGTHGRSNLEQLLLGSVTEKIVRYASCPVLTVSRGGIVKPNFKHVLVPFDFNNHSKAAFKTALEFTEPDAGIDLLYVFEEDVHPAHYAWGVASALELMPDVTDKAKSKMKEVIAELGAGKRSINLIVEEGVPHKKIAEYVNKSEVDLVIMATQGLVGLDRFLLGSTTEHVIRSVSRPILTLKHKNLI